MIVLTWLALAAAAHPIHTTVLELKWDVRSQSVRGTLRIFEDDLRAAAGTGGVTTYVARHVELSAGASRVSLESCGERRVADAVLVCLEGTAPSPREWRIRNTILMERFDDQINIVRVDNGKSTTLLLTSRASTQSIP